MNKASPPTIHLYQNDLPDSLHLGPVVAIDTEAMGLNNHRDRLCLVQLSQGDGVCHLIKIANPRMAAPNLVKLLEDPAVTKLFHFARFDVALLRKTYGAIINPVFCTKIASKLTRTFTEKHGLKDLCKDFLGVDLSKESQTSDWGADTLTPEQMKYAASDVLYLHRLKEKLELMLAREGRLDLAQACFDFLPHRADLDLQDFSNPDIFSH